jgi:uncharacterized protein with NAD-binding domain and iron-sulfur cluster
MQPGPRSRGYGSNEPTHFVEPLVQSRTLSPLLSGQLGTSERRSVKKRVLVLGGGVGGMTAAHELAEREFSVTVIEDRDVLGGKARSIFVQGSGQGGRQDLPGEHGFRFFPGFYQHLPDTMSRIPFGGQPHGVLDNLREGTKAEIARTGTQTPLLVPMRFPNSTSDIAGIVRDVTQGATGLTKGDAAHFLERLLILLTSSDARRYGEWENTSWWQFSGAASRSAAYQGFLADGLTRSLVAAQAREMSARTAGCILLQLLFDIWIPGRQADRLLDGPTSNVFINPWRDHLRTLGVELRLRTRVDALHCSHRRIRSVTVTGPDGRQEDLQADWYISAVPVEHMARLATPAIREADTSLDNLDRLKTRWMNGIVFFLRSDVPLVRGHVVYIDSEWRLTSISPRQFWRDGMEGFGDGDVGGILSVDVSDWTTPGPITHKPAMECTKEEVFTEVWGQLQAHLNRRGSCVLDDKNLVRWFLDTDVRFPELRRARHVRDDINLEPLLINTVGSWALRPNAATNIDNLFLASDYVRTYTDLATMEAANEAGRRAANEVLDYAGSGQPRCELWPLKEPGIFAPARLLDGWRYERAQRHELPAHMKVDIGK